MENEKTTEKMEEQEKTFEEEMQEELEGKNEDNDAKNKKKEAEASSTEDLTKDWIKEKGEEGKEKPMERLSPEMSKEVKPEATAEQRRPSMVFALRTTANREDQVMDFIVSNAEKKKIAVYAVLHPPGMRGYIFIESASKGDAEQATQNIPYARGILREEVPFKDIEPMLEQVKKDINIRKNDIAEIISGPFKRESCKITRIDKAKGEVVVELLEAAVPIPITVKIDAVKVIRREGETPAEEEDDS